MSSSALPDNDLLTTQRPHASPVGDGLRVPDDFSAPQLADVLRRHWLTLTLLPLLAAVGTALYVVRQPRVYASSGSFIPQSAGGGQSRLAGLAAQFGVSVSTGDTRQSPAFYQELLTSTQILKELVQSPLPVDATGARTTTLMDVWKTDGSSIPALREQAIGRARSNLSVDRGRETGIVRFTIVAPSPVLAKAAGARLLELINDFDTRSRRTQAEAERQFVRERLEEARSDLRRAEQAVASFERQNRVTEGSPELMVEHERLRREVQLEEGVFSSLAQGFAQSRIEAMRNTPAIAVIDVPDVPAGPEPRRAATKAVVGLIVGFLLALAIAAARELSLQMRGPRRSASDRATA